MAIKGYCGLKSCCECSTGCDLDESIPCSPDCKNLTQDGKILIVNCLKAKCVDVKYIFGMPACSDRELLQTYGAVAEYPYYTEGKKKKYNVDLEVRGYISVEVEADDFEEAKDIACEEASNMDFGSLENIEWEAKSAENENGESKRYK